MNDDIKKALEAIYSVKAETQPVAEAEPQGAQAAQAAMGDEAELKGTFNAKTFGMMLGMDSTEANLLASFLAKHKKGAAPSRNELLTAADTFRRLVDADPKVTNQAMMMLRRVSAAEAIKMESEEMVEADEIEQAVGEIAEGIRVTKEGIEECWGDMAAPETAASEAGEKMTVNITTPNKQISVTTDSAAEIMNVLKLAGIDAGAAMGDVDGDGDHDMADHEAEQGEPAMVGAAPIAVIQAPDSEGGEGSGDEEAKDEEGEEESEEETKESAKPDFLDVDKDGDKEESMADAAKDKEEMEESLRILKLAGLDESKLANSPAGTCMDEPMEADDLPSMPGDGAGHSDFGANRANNQGENPMGIHSADVEESFEVAMGEYRKFVAESILRKETKKD